MTNNISFKKFPPIIFVKVAFFLRNLFKNLSQKMLPSQVILMDYATSFLVIRAICVAAELNIADILIEKPLSIDELAKKTNTNPDALYRMMRTLASESIFKDIGNKTFTNSKMSMALTEGNKKLKYFIRHHLGVNNWNLASEMKYCVETGNNSVKKIFGVEPFELLEKDYERNQIFNRAMTDTNEISVEAFISYYDFSKYKTIIDIGGGHGYMLSCILYKNPNSNGILFDLPHVVKGSDNFVKFGVSDRAKAIGGDFFKEINAKGDLYILKNIFHDWDDEKSSIILKNLYKAMPDNAKLLIIDAVIKNDNKPAFGKVIDLEMLIGTTGGVERTKEEFDKLLSSNGFKMKRVIDNVTPFSFIEVVKH